MESLTPVIHLIARSIELLGVGIIVVGLCYAFFTFLSHLRDRKAYVMMRQQIGKAILLGLEVLVAADIIMTITTEPTLQNVAVLGLVVLIRTFLSFSLEVELEGKWPWQSRASEGDGVMGADDDTITKD